MEVITQQDIEQGREGYNGTITTTKPEKAPQGVTAQPRPPAWPRVDDDGFHADLACLGM
jgi:hypothetical protein